MLCFGQVCTGDVHASQYAMLSGYDSLLIWLIVMLHTMLMLISCSCIVIASCYFIMAQHIAFKFNRIKLNLNNCWLSHGATISN